MNFDIQLQKVLFVLHFRSKLLKICGDKFNLIQFVFGEEVLIGSACVKEKWESKVAIWPQLEIKRLPFVDLLFKICHIVDLV